MIMWTDPLSIFDCHTEVAALEDIDEFQDIG